ncbi:hypothetical protein Tco_0195136 [Tanacetum coccineum]
MHGDETPDAYLNHAQEYVDALAAIGESVKDKDLIMLVVSHLCEEYKSIITKITSRQSPTAFNKLHALYYAQLSSCRTPPHTMTKLGEDDADWGLVILLLITPCLRILCFLATTYYLSILSERLLSLSLSGAEAEEYHGVINVVAENAWLLFHKLHSPFDDYFRSLL